MAPMRASIAGRCRYGRPAPPVVASDLRGPSYPDHRTAARAMLRGPGDYPPESTFSRNLIRLTMSWRHVFRPPNAPFTQGRGTQWRPVPNRIAYAIGHEANPREPDSAVFRLWRHRDQIASCLSVLAAIQAPRCSFGSPLAPLVETNLGGECER
jgi:hypothetical protein